MPLRFRLRVRPALFLPPLLALAGCGGGGGESTPPASPPPEGDVGNYLSLAVGNRWVYQTNSPLPGVLPTQYELQMVSGTATVAGAPALVHRAARLEGGWYMTGHYGLTGSGLFGVSEPADVGTELSKLLIVRLPLKAGDSYVAYDHPALATPGDSDGDGLPESHALRRTVDVLGTETVTVPAGTFSALKVRSQTHHRFTYSKDNSYHTFDDTVVDWYVPNLGRVKTTVASTFYESATAQTTHYSDVHQLSGYKVNGISTDTTAPTVTGTLPAANATVSGDTEISVTFSEAMDPFSLAYPLGTASDHFTLVDAGGQPVPAQSVYYSSGKLIFQPQNPLTPGLYTATLVDGSDALGNPLAAGVSWTFLVE